MPRQRTQSAKHCLIAFSAFWLLFCAFGSSFLHESIGCSHEGSAETVEHHDADEAHWVAVTSADFSDFDCLVCIMTDGFGIDGAESLAIRNADVSRPLSDMANASARACRGIVRSPRAPPATFPFV